MKKAHITLIIIAFIGIVALISTLLSAKVRIMNNEDSAIASLKTIAAGETDYNNNSMPHSYTGNMDMFRSGGATNGPYFVDQALTYGLKSGYRFTVAASCPDAEGALWCWSATAWPVVYGKTGIRSLYIDETCVIRSQDLGGNPANVAIPVIKK